ncbi:MAG: DUF547 domain-containing protein, partial [Planctomycetota bacterium]
MTTAERVRQFAVPTCLLSLTLSLFACSGGDSTTTVNDTSDTPTPADTTVVSTDTTDEPAVATIDMPTATEIRTPPVPAVAVDEPDIVVLPTTQSTTLDPVNAVNRQFANILADVVTPEGLVRYDLLKMPARRAALVRVVEGYAMLERPDDRNAALAILSNAYNANVLLKVVEAQASGNFTTVVNEKGFFDADRITVVGESMTLNDLENKQIRPYGDARIHAALVCAAISCPPLRAEPFTAAELDAQFDDQSRRWVNDATKNFVRNDTLVVSRIFDWY